MQSNFCGPLRLLEEMCMPIPWQKTVMKEGIDVIGALSKEIMALVKKKGIRNRSPFYSKKGKVN